MLEYRNKSLIPQFIISSTLRNLNDISVVAFTSFYALQEMTCFQEIFCDSYVK